MNRSLTAAFALISLVVTSIAAGQEPATTPATPTTNPTTMGSHLRDGSYGVGFDLGRQLAGAPVKFDVERVIEGLRDALAGKPSAVPEAQLQAAMERLQAEAMAGAEAAQKVQGEANAKAGDAYRAENGKKPGIVTTASGLQVETIKEGTGESPKPTDTVKVHYTGTLIDGTKFDSSVDRGEPISFPLNGVIKGWTEGVQLMKVGGKSRLVIPPAIGYGPGGQGPIPPNATLVFEVELLEIAKK